MLAALKSSSFLPVEWKSAMLYSFRRLCFASYVPRKKKQKAEEKLGATKWRNKHIYCQKDNLLFPSFDVVHIMTVTMSGLIRPEGGINAKKKLLYICSNILSGYSSVRK